MDLTILLWIQAHMRCDVLDFIFTLITKLGNTGIIWILLTLILLIRRDTRYTGLVMAIAFILSAAVVNLGIKPLVSRPRPFQVHPIELAIAAPYGTSFPSATAPPPLRLPGPTLSQEKTGFGGGFWHWLPPLPSPACTSLSISQQTCWPASSSVLS